jgi:tetratricopeptide (TPR) repeat protein
MAEANKHIFFKHFHNLMRLIYAVFILLLALITSAQCQQTAEYWIKLGNDLNTFEYIDAGRNAEAVKAFDKAIDVDPSNKEAWRGLRDALRSIAVATNNKEDSRQADNVDAVYAHGTNLNDPRSAPALSDHENRTAPNATSGDVAFTYATENVVIDVLNGTPYFNASERDAFENYGEQIKVTLNMTSNTSDSERASRLVFEALFKYPRVTDISVVCYEIIWDRIGSLSSYKHDYKMTRADADEVGDWVNLDLSRYDSFHSNPYVLPPEIDQHLAQFGVQIPNNTVMVGNSYYG